MSLRFPNGVVPTGRSGRQRVAQPPGHHQQVPPLEACARLSQDRTNGIGSFRVNLKRGCHSAHHQMSAKHLHRHAGVSLRAQGSAAVLKSLDAWQMSNIYE